MSKKRKNRQHSLSVKQEAVRRVRGGEAVSAVAHSFTVRRTQIYVWLKQLRDHGVIGRPRGRPRHGPALAAPGSAGREVELERVIGQQQVVIDFFRQALRQVEAARRQHSGRGAGSSGSSSLPGRAGRKAEE